MKISLVIPNYNRTNLLVESFINVLNDQRIDEIIINDDFSSNFQEVQTIIESLNNTKIKLFKNQSNLGTFFNKLDAIKKSTNDWCILLDSDNIIDEIYLNKIYSNSWNENKIICPQRLLHHPENCLNTTKTVFFDYQNFLNIKLNFNYCSDNFDMELLPVLLNTGNFFVNKNTYIKAFDANQFNRNVDIADVAYFNYLFLNSNQENYLEVSGDLEYIHRVHHGSFYLNNSHLSSSANNFLKKLFKREI